MKKNRLCTAVVLFSLLLAGLQPALAQDDPAPEEPPTPPGFPLEPRIPGRLEGTGTHFEITDSEYLNITLDSTEPVSLRLESVPQMVIMDIESAQGATSTQITLRGFSASTTFYKYEDDHHNGMAFTTDGVGGCTYAQGLSEPHHVFIQRNPGTRFIPSDTVIGTWDPVNRIYTLTTDVYETIQVDEDNLTLDGAGHTVAGAGSALSYGVFVPHSRSCVTVRGVGARGCGAGIFFSGSDGTVTGNSASDCGVGIEVWFALNNIVTGNTASKNGIGIRVWDHCWGNVLSGNTANSNRFVGIWLHYFCYGTTLTRNTLDSNDCGILLWDATDTIITDNTVSNNNHSGIELGGQGFSSIARNIISGNACGFYNGRAYAELYNNSFLGNAQQVLSYGGAMYNLDPPVGGNYWSDWQPPLHPDGDGDGFVDEPYVISSYARDNFPLVDNDSDCVSDKVEDGAPNGGDGNKDGVLDSDQDNVASLPNAADGRYVTLASPHGTQLVDVIAIGNPSPGAPPSGVAFPVGFFEFKVDGITAGGSTTVTLYLPQGVETYYKYGPTPDDPSDHSYEFLFDGTTGAEIIGQTVVLHLVDGQRGDDDVTANGVIVEPGGAAMSARRWLGFLPPLDGGGKRLFKRGSTVPVKFRIRDWQGSPVTDAYATLAVYYLRDGAPAGEAEVVSTAAGDWGDQFRYSPKDDLYIFNLSTKHPSYYDWYTYRIVVTLDDGQTREADFSLR
jgi:parallel beta-helix repeat protein